MTTQTHDFDIAHADFRLIHEEDPKRAIEWMHLLFCDEILLVERIAFIKAVGSESQTINERNFDSVIELIRSHGLLVAVREGKLSFADVEPVTWSVSALERVNEAMNAIPEFIMASTNPSPVSLEQVMDWIGTIELTDSRIVRMPDSPVSVKRDSANVAMGASTAKDSETTSDKPKVDPQHEFYGIDSKQRVFIKANVEEIPNGLCWIGICDGESLIAKLIPTLQWFDGTWVWRRELRHFSDDQSILDKRLKLFLIPARESTRDQFDTSEVRSIVDSWDDGEQKSSALEFLGEGTTK